MANQRRSGSDEIRKGVFDRVTSEFDYQRVNGLTSAPPITQNPTRKTSEPYIYIYSVDSNEVDATKNSTAREYAIYVDICTRYNSYGGGQRQVNRMVDEVVRALRNGGYPDLSSVGYSIYNLTLGEIRDFTFKERGANYYKATIEVYVTADSIALPQSVNPIQALIYSFSNFTHTPTSTKIETYDSGDITFNETYPSNNQGWDFTSASYAIAQSAQGSLDDRIYSVESTDTPLGITGTLNYEFNTDDTVTTTITDTVAFDRIKSLRFGSSSATSWTENDLRNLSNFGIMFGTENPVGTTITINPGLNEYPYIMFDADHSISEISGPLGLNEISAFTVTEIGGFKIYRLTGAIPYEGLTLTYTLE